MLTVVKNQARVTYLYFKYGLMRAMVNKVSFLSNIIFMALNNASFIVLWVIFYSIRDNIGGASLGDILILWGLSSGAYGVSHVIFEEAYRLGPQITNGKLDSYLVQPKNVLLSAISGVSPSALGDILYSYILLFVSGITFKKFILYTLFNITGGLLFTSIAVITGSLSFWMTKSDTLASTLNGMMTQFSTYPEGIFNQTIKVILYLVIPAGFLAYLPLRIINAFNWIYLGAVVLATSIFVTIAYITFYRGLRRYSSSNLMIARI